MDSYDSRSDSVKIHKNVNADLHLSEKKEVKRKSSKEEIKKLVNIMQSKKPSKADLLEKQLEQECQELDSQLKNHQYVTIQ